MERGMLKVKQKRIALNSNHAVAYAVRDAHVDVIAAYPITPQTTIMEKLSEMVANGEIDAELIHVESEHSALSAVIGASAAGARVFTATSSQGLELMHEILHIASGMRLPIVMAVPTRALSAPISIWNDYSDLMNARDSSWITIIASTAQEVYDSIIQAYMVAEDPRVLLPFMVAYDGFLMSHTSEPLSLPEDSSAIRDLVPRRDRIKLDTDKPVTMGTITDPRWYYEIKYQQVKAMQNASIVLKETSKTIYEVLGRKYDPVEAYRMDNAEIAILTYGGLFGTVQEAVDIIRDKGLNIGAIRLRQWRPFPTEELTHLMHDIDTIIVIDRAISYGASIQGPVALEVYPIAARMGVQVFSVIAGIGQRTVLENDVLGIVNKILDYLDQGVIPIRSIYWGVRGGE
ncbi:MAG: ferredoxin oxidoreductase [Desulfurococcales archaeon]|nr:ferredoxin oxidoreductase [Desulfurococcales archaeon]